MIYDPYAHPFPGYHHCLEGQPQRTRTFQAHVRGFANAPSRVSS